MNAANKRRLGQRNDTAGIEISTPHAMACIRSIRSGGASVAEQYARARELEAASLIGLFGSTGGYTGATWPGRGSIFACWVKAFP